MMYRYDPDSKEKGGEERDFEKKTAETGDWQADAYASFRCFPGPDHICSADLLQTERSYHNQADRRAD